MKNSLILTAALIALASTPVLAKNPDMASIDKAKVLIPIEITNLKGNIVSFVIPENAREHDKAGNGVKVSGLYDVEKGKKGQCPYMLSSDIHKKVKNYNPVNGRAIVDATFSTEDQAKAAYDSKCVVIENVE